jgi:hypothetical protein
MAAYGLWYETRPYENQSPLGRAGKSTNAVELR